MVSVGAAGEQDMRSVNIPEDKLVLFFGKNKLINPSEENLSPEWAVLMESKPALSSWTWAAPSPGSSSTTGRQGC